MSGQPQDRFTQQNQNYPPAIQHGAPTQNPQQPVYQLQYQPQKPPRRRFNYRLACLGCLFSMIAVFAVFACTIFAVLAILYNQLDERMTEQLKKAEQQEVFQTVHIYDRYENELHQLFGEGRRTKIKLADMPAHVIDATIAVEDHTFYENPGVDWVAVGRAAVEYFGESETATGGSTITQQLVRNIAFDYGYRTERSLQRKVEEIMMAMILTREKNKDEILEMYLNQIYYGNLAYGIEAAAKTYFGKQAKTLSLAEASLLAGLPQAPAELDPLNPDPAIQEKVYNRRKVVLDMMVQYGKVSREEADKALAEQLVYADPNVSLRSPHFTLYAEQELKTLIESLGLPPSYLTSGGLKVITTLDSNYQQLAENVARQQIATIKLPNNANNAAVVVIKPVTGEILAMVGSVDYRDDSIDGRVNVAISLKQPGSAIKPLTYAAALERGYDPAYVLWDVPTQIVTAGETYSPVNYDRRFRGPVRIRQALANSYNVPAVQMLREIGLDYFLKFANRFRIESLGLDTSKYGFSLTLGGGDLTPLELTQAYTVFANNGNLVSTTSILCVIDNTGKIVYQYEKGCEGRGNQDEGTINASVTSKPILDPRIAYVISNILADNVARSPAMGTNSPLNTEGIVSSVKTGTTNDFKDNWTVGFTRNVAVGVWVGNTDSTPMYNTTGLTGAAPIWHDIITGIYTSQSMETLKHNGTLLPDEPTPPPGLSQRRVCDLNSLHDPAPACNQSRVEWVLDTPPLVPDAHGNLVQSKSAFAPTPLPDNGPRLITVDPSIVQALVFPLDAGFASALAQGSTPQRYCLVPNEVSNQVPQATEQIFIQPPPFGDQAAYRWSMDAGVAILPTIPCTPEMLAAQTSIQAEGVTAIITSPRPFDSVTGMVQVLGSVAWPSDRGMFFKMEISGPAFPDWTTFGSTHPAGVVNGLLDQFGAEGLPSGTYKIRIAIVGTDAGILATSAEIPITVTGR